MAFITIFTAPKAFTDAHIAVIQRNAIASWTQLADVKVIVLGDEPGLADAARDLGVNHIADIPRSASGAPLMDAMFRLARENSKSQLYCVVNADIILLPQFVETARQVAALKNKFVVLGQRWDLDITEALDFSPGWAERLLSRVQNQGRLHRPVGSDYFLFPDACYTDLPPFVIGRAGWDNWMIYQARKSGFPAIDATQDVMVIHQNHDYSHLPGGQPHYNHPETSENIRLAGGRATTRFTLLDTDRRLENGRILAQKMTTGRLWRLIESWPLLTLGSNRLSNVLWRLRKLFLKPKNK